jgi:uncharacterized damage-inducible protein DinB
VSFVVGDFDLLPFDTNHLLGLSFNRKTGALMKLAIVVLTLASATAAQSKSPISDALRQMLGGREKNTVAAFEEMPADKYDYKPTADQMTFGHLAAHIAEANYYFCANTADVPEPKVDEMKGTEGKDKLVAAMKASFEFCHTALEKADDGKLSGDIKWFDGKPKARAWAALGLASSWADHYGAAAMYLRLNGVLPPTAKKK